mmetsp:Transcript_43025/g.71720  ORF Transcript_43025/g.71720 Transcript_43025/m.71720 type:complete len:133 (-) Transcript_43025:261-659(-)|eukprot:CAMPEP_0198199280 /NCGR_PEP_ID=MMETSP1445-20131203/2596_1 /TAXON_ID=36898 /ORGANISM="Pyramimonas sp., Strain CCMP2087" /LENGTH=132 /DNA_ID=CAMNT_0043869073 /DNA_START=170 /DNA_END=568 /DNA_ORIENTATION=+
MASGDKESQWGCPRDARCAAPKLPPDEIAKELRALPDWTLSEDGSTISRAFVAKKWSSAINFINALSEISEAANHHPDFQLTGYRSLKVDLTTHASGGLTQLDIDLAAKLDAIEVEYSPKWLKEHLAQQTAK